VHRCSRTTTTVESLLRRGSEVDSFGEATFLLGSGTVSFRS